jgi:hypothetical protein
MTQEKEFFVLQFEMTFLNSKAAFITHRDRLFDTEPAAHEHAATMIRKFEARTGWSVRSYRVMRAVLLPL